MNHLARAVVDAFAFLELFGDETVDPDDACRAIEVLTATLRDCSKAELDALRAAAADALKEEESGPRPVREESLDFYRSFVENAGLA